MEKIKKIELRYCH